MATITGTDCKLYRAATLTDTQDATIDAAVWTEIQNARDVTLTLDSQTADASTRAGVGWASEIVTTRSATVELQMLWDQGGSDTNFAALRDAYLNKTTIPVAVMDGDINADGSQGLVAFWNVSTFSRPEPLNDVVVADVTLTLAAVTASTNAPNWYTEST